jgi:hypothetical protein
MHCNLDVAFRRVGLAPQDINGKPAVVLGDFTITYYNYYFVVNGNVPLAVAEELYAIEPTGRMDIRSGGDCGCRPPETWAHRIKPNGKEAVAKEESDKILIALSEGSEIYKAAMKTGKWDLCDSQEEYLSYPAFVSTYHIDSELGLYIFLQILRKHNLITQ